MTSAYLWGKVLHVVIVAGWFAGSFHLPRCFVYLATVRPGSQGVRERPLLMPRRLHRLSSLL